MPLERVEEARERGGRLERGGLFKASAGKEEVRRSFEANKVSTRQAYCVRGSPIDGLERPTHLEAWDHQVVACAL